MLKSISFLEGLQFVLLPHFSYSLAIPESQLFFSAIHFFQSFTTSGFPTEQMLVEMEKESFNVAATKSYFIFEGVSRTKRGLKERTIHNHPFPFYKTITKNTPCVVAE